MELGELNSYLSCLHGPANVINVELDKSDIAASLSIKIEGDIGTKDKGEIELTFHGVEIIALPLGLIAPIQVSISEDSINDNYSEENCKQFILKDDVDVEWLIYAQGFDVKVLPVFYGDN